VGRKPTVLDRLRRFIPSSIRIEMPEAIQVEWPESPYTVREILIETPVPPKHLKPVPEDYSDLLFRHATVDRRTELQRLLDMSEYGDMFSLFMRIGMLAERAGYRHAPNAYVAPDPKRPLLHTSVVLWNGKEDGLVVGRGNGWKEAAIEGLKQIYGWEE
jgi:hypothetical protein